MSKSILDEIEEIACRTYIEHKAKSLLLPLVKNVVSATDNFNSTPSITNGSRRYDAKKALNEAIKEFAQDVYARWGIGPDEFNKIIDRYLEV